MPKTGKDIKTPLSAHTVEERGGHMADFAVLEHGEELARRLVARFGPAMGADQHPGLLVVAPEICLTTRWGILECGTVLLSGNERHCLDCVHACGAVSYGLSGRDSITLSSRERNYVWVAIQRELVCMDGTVLERQEIPVKMGQGMDELQTLALVGAMLLLGAQPEELCKA